jgi:uncharacterized protein (TIGR03083 family)
MTGRMPLARGERTDFLDLLRGLQPEQWNAPSLCADWTVLDVVAHVLSYDERSIPATAALFLRGRLRFRAVNDLALRNYRNHTPAALIDLLAGHLEPRGLTAGFDGGIALTDGMIHQQDIRRPLGQPREIPAKRLLAALPIAITAPTLPARRNIRGLRLLATDIDWSHGSGAEVRGPGEAILMALAGRPAALLDLTGPGLETLHTRVVQ